MIFNVEFSWSILFSILISDDTVGTFMLPIKTVKLVSQIPIQGYGVLTCCIVGK